MEKLIELLNEYIPKGWGVAHGGKSIFYEGLNYTDRVISKSFGFIKWLVENDKINIEKVIDTAKSFGIDTYYYEEGINDNDILLLMVLAISDTPIEDLISYLK